MARPQNNLKLTTPISITKAQKARMRVYAEASKKRNGNENDSEVLERILFHYESTHPVEDRMPKPTYISKKIN